MTEEVELTSKLPDTIKLSEVAHVKTEAPLIVKFAHCPFVSNVGSLTTSLMITSVPQGMTPPFQLPVSAQLLFTPPVQITVSGQT